MPNQPNITLSQLADHLEKGELLHKQFDFSDYNSKTPEIGHTFPHCGTSGCAIGELPALDSRFKFHIDGFMSFNGRAMSPSIVADYFELSEEAASHLFYPDEQQPEVFGGDYLKSNATIDDVIGNIRAFLDFFGEPNTNQ